MLVTRTRTNRVFAVCLIALAVLTPLLVGAIGTAVCALLIPVCLAGLQNMVGLRPSRAEVLRSLFSGIPVLAASFFLAASLLTNLLSEDRFLSLATASLAGFTSSLLWMRWRIAAERPLVGGIGPSLAETFWTLLIVLALGAIAIPSYQNYTIGIREGVDACRKYSLRATFLPIQDSFAVSEQASVLIMQSSRQRVAQARAAGWVVLSAAGTRASDRTFEIARQSMATPSSSVGFTELYRLGDSYLIGRCKEASFQLVAPENVMLRENLINPNTSDILVNGKDAIAITGKELVEPPVEIRIARRAFRHRFLASMASTPVYTSMTLALSGAGSMALFFAEGVREWLLKRFIEPLLDKLPILRRRAKKRRRNRANK